MNSRILQERDMIFVAGTLTIDPSAVDAFLADVAAMRPKVLEEAGCYHYSLLAEDRAGGVINVLEQWEDDEMRSRSTSPHAVDNRIRTRMPRRT